MTIGEKIRIKREEKGYTQEGLAEKLVTSRQTIYNWENDVTSPNSKDLKNISTVLDCTYDYLLGDGVEIKEVQQETKPKSFMDKLLGASDKVLNGAKKHWRKVYLYFFYVAIGCTIFGAIILGASSLFGSAMRNMPSNQGGNNSNVDTGVNLFSGFAGGLSIFLFVIAGISLIIGLVLFFKDKKAQERYRNEQK